MYVVVRSIVEGKEINFRRIPLLLSLWKQRTSYLVYAISRPDRQGCPLTQFHFLRIFMVKQEEQELNPL